jgi:hypothetical protein
MTWGNLPRRSNPDGAFVLNALRRVDPQPVPPWEWRKRGRRAGRGIRTARVFHF